MKKTIIYMGLFLLVGLMSAQAQGQRGQRGQRQDPKELAKATAETWQEEFGLSDEQYTKIYPS